MSIYYLNNNSYIAEGAYINNKSVSSIYEGKNLVWSFGDYTKINLSQGKLYNYAVQNCDYFYFEKVNDFNDLDINNTRKVSDKGKSAYAFLYNTAENPNGAGIVSTAKSFYFSNLYSSVLRRVCKNMNISHITYVYTEDGVKKTKTLSEYERQACFDNCINMCFSFYGCNNITGSPVCGKKTTDMSYAYYGCDNITGSPVCGENVVNFSRGYMSCDNLNGYPVCGENVVDFDYTYYMCNNLTGSPVVGSNVVNMDNTYNFCKKIHLENDLYIPKTVRSMVETFGMCENMAGNIIMPNINTTDELTFSAGNRMYQTVAGPIFYHISKNSSWYNAVVSSTTFSNYNALYDAYYNTRSKSYFKFTD